MLEKEESPVQVGTIVRNLAEQRSKQVEQTPPRGGLMRLVPALGRVATGTRRGLWTVTIGAPIVLVLMWWWGSAGSTNPYFPPLQTILQRFQALWLFENFVSDVLPSLGNLVVSFMIAVVLGVSVGVLLGLNRTASALLDPVIHFWRAIPPVALVPIIVALFGFGDDARVLSITIAAIFPTLIATVDGLRAIEPLVKDMSRIYQLTRWERIRDVYLPAAGPRIATGMQVSLQTAFVVMIASEMLGSATGIGAKTLLAQQSFAIADMWAGILLLGIIGFVANTVFEVVQRRALHWYFGAQAQGRAN